MLATYRRVGSRSGREARAAAIFRGRGRASCSLFDGR